MDLARMNRWMSHTNTLRGPPETILILNAAATQDANLLSNFAVMLFIKLLFSTDYFKITFPITQQLKN